VNSFIYEMNGWELLNVIKLYLSLVTKSKLLTENKLLL